MFCCDRRALRLVVIARAYSDILPICQTTINASNYRLQPIAAFLCSWVYGSVVRMGYIAWLTLSLNVGLQ